MSRKTKENSREKEKIPGKSRFELPRLKENRNYKYLNMIASFWWRHFISSSSKSGVCPALKRSKIGSKSFWNIFANDTKLLKSVYLLEFWKGRHRYFIRGSKSFVEQISKSGFLALNRSHIFAEHSNRSIDDLLCRISI